ncbi:MAG: FAD-linked oxidase C-terminal domain-containing protein [Acidobacteriota bacterium]
MSLPTELFDRRQLITDPAERLTYETDAGFDDALPDGVFYPESTSDVRRLVEWAAENEVPIVARGAGTGLAGGAVAEHGGIVIVPTRMDRILELDPIGRTASVEAGVVNLDLATQAQRAGLYYPPDPSSGRSCCLGGNLGTNAGGPHCFKYGVTANYVTGLEVVLAGGRSVRLGGALDAPEIDLCGLIVGSEGTLGVVTRAELRLLRQPPGVKTLMVSFESLAAAGDAVSAVIAAGLVPATLEVIDQSGMRVIEDFCDAGLPVEAGAVLIAEVDGYREGLEAQASRVATLLEQHGGYDLYVAGTEAERQRIWYGRKSAAGAMARLAPSYYLTDVTVRRSRLAVVLGKVEEICGRYGLRTANFFHAGDGNLHPLIPGDPKDPVWVENVHHAVREVIEICLEENGSITGEHGVGLEKRSDMLRMYGGAELSAMRDVKEAFDPQNLLNPGKVLPDDNPEPDHAEPRLPAGDTCSPSTTEEAAGLLRGSSEAGRRVQIGGAATSDDHNCTDIWLSTSEMRGIHSFAPEDLFVTVGAGTRVDELRRHLEPYRVEVPLLSPWAEATVGGLVATNLNAPLRMRYGGLRDITLCSTVALADGRVLRAGRPLVKNVAGYDLTKALVGSHGSLGLLTEVTLKLVPTPRVRRTLALPVAGLAAGLELARPALAEALVCSAVVVARGLTWPGIEDHQAVLLLTAEGAPEDVETELTAIRRAWRASGAGEIVETALTGNAAWAAFLGTAGPNRFLVRIGVRSKSLEEYLPSLSAESACLVDVAAGLIYGATEPKTAEAARDELEALRRPALAVGGYAVAMDIPPPFRAALDPWGYRSDAIDIMRRLRERWDPAGILSPGSFL